MARNDPIFSEETAREYALCEKRPETPETNIVSAIFFGMKKIGPTGEPMFVFLNEEEGIKNDR